MPILVEDLAPVFSPTLADILHIALLCGLWSFPASFFRNAMVLGIVLELVVKKFILYYNIRAARFLREERELQAIMQENVRVQQNMEVMRRGIEEMRRERAEMMERLIMLQRLDRGGRA